ncbi:hypothetical protein Q7V23_10545, partial [Streptococcus suis]|nr:hypothetical protein [Streptococcus suis]
SLLSKIGLTTTLKNAWTTSRQVNFFWVANFNLKFGKNTIKQTNLEKFLHEAGQKAQHRFSKLVSTSQRSG